MKVHPLTACYPMMSEDQVNALAEDIRANGLLFPVTVKGDVLLDGRNRMLACEVAGVELQAVELEDGKDEIAFIYSTNKRRDATKSQKAMTAAYQANAPKGRNWINTANAVITQERAASENGVSVDTLQRAKYVIDRSEELAREVHRGDKTLAQALRELRAEELEETTPDPPEGAYRVIYADPPWKYGDALAISKDGTGESYGPADAHYPQMSIEELCALPIADLAEDNAVLFLWATAPLLEDAFRVVKAWGFAYKTNFVWDKVKHNMGHYSSVRHEHLLLCTRGSCTPDVPKLFDSVQNIERTGHSVKPEEFRAIIDTLYTRGAKIELFARTQHEGWTGWGQQA